MISVTSLSTFLFCPRKLYLEKVLKIVAVPKEALVKGSVRHGAYDEINKSEERIVKSIKPKAAFKAVLGLYKEEYLKLLKRSVVKNKSSLNALNIDLSLVFKETWPFILDEARMRASNTFFFIDSTDLYGESLWEALVPKFESEVRIKSDEMQLSGVVDQLLIYKEEIIPVELKTGKMPERGVWPGHKVQLGAYILMLEEERRAIKKGYVRYLDTNEIREIYLNPFLKDEVIDLRDKTSMILESNELPPILENKNKCRACELREKCYSMPS